MIRAVRCPSEGSLLIVVYSLAVTDIYKQFLVIRLGK